MATVGTDPEFFVIIRNTRSILVSENILNSSQRFHSKGLGSVGKDGARVLFEVRPTPCVSPRQVASRIVTLLKKFREKIERITEREVELAVTEYLPLCGDGTNDYRVTECPENKKETSLENRFAVANPIPGAVYASSGVGGHLHIGGRHNTTMTKALRPPQSVVITVGCTYLWCLEDYMRGKMRRRSRYGDIEDIRSNYNTVEFRSPSSVWLSQPSLILATLSLFQSLVDRCSLVREIPTSLLHEGRKYWTRTEHNDTYLDAVKEFILPLVRKEDIAVIEFYRKNLQRLRRPDNTILLDLEKWRDL